MHLIIEGMMKFQKGNQINKGRTPWNKGIPHSEEQKLKLKNSWKYEKHNSLEIIDKRRQSLLKKWETDDIWVQKQLKRYRENPPNRGRKFSIEHNRKISLAKKGIPNLKLKGIPRSEETKQIFNFVDTKPERMLQIALSLHGIPFVKQKSLPGQPDIFIEPNICVFVDGDYWHANPLIYKPDDVMKKGYKAKELWEKDFKFSQKLNSMGYQVIRIWEKDIEQDVNHCAENIIKLIQQVRGKITI